MHREHIEVACFISPQRTEAHSFFFIFYFPHLPFSLSLLFFLSSFKPVDNSEQMDRGN